MSETSNAPGVWEMGRALPLEAEARRLLSLAVPPAASLGSQGNELEKEIG